MKTKISLFLLSIVLGAFFALYQNLKIHSIITVSSDQISLSNKRIPTEIATEKDLSFLFHKKTHLFSGIFKLKCPNFSCTASLIRENIFLSSEKCKVKNNMKAKCHLVSNNKKYPLEKSLFSDGFLLLKTKKKFKKIKKIKISAKVSNQKRLKNTCMKPLHLISFTNEKKIHLNCHINKSQASLMTHNCKHQSKGAILFREHKNHIQAIGMNQSLDNSVIHLNRKKIDHMIERLL